MFISFDYLEVIVDFRYSIISGLVGGRLDYSRLRRMDSMEVYIIYYFFRN